MHGFSCVCSFFVYLLFFYWKFPPNRFVEEKKANIVDCCSNIVRTRWAEKTESIIRYTIQSCCRFFRCRYRRRRYSLVWFSFIYFKFNPSLRHEKWTLHTNERRMNVCTAQLVPINVAKCSNIPKAQKNTPDMYKTYADSIFFLSFSSKYTYTNMNHCRKI